MPDFEKQFEAFQLSTESSEELKMLASMQFTFPKRADAFVVETVLIEAGKRMVITTALQW